MYGMTSQQIQDAAGPGGESQAFDYAKPFDSFTNAYKNSDLGESALGISNDLAGQVDVRDKQFTADTGMTPPHHSYTFPEVAQAMQDDTVKPSDAALNYYRAFSGPTFLGNSMGRNMASSAMQGQVAWEKQIQQYNTDHGTNYQTFDKMVPQTQQSVLSAQQNDATTTARSPGFFTGFLPRLAGQAGASVNLDNAPNLAMMAGLATGTGEAQAGATGLQILGRYATAGLTNMAMGAANSFGFTKSQRDNVGVPLSNQEIASQAPGNFLGGVLFHGINEAAGAIGKYFFPAKTPEVAVNINDNLNAAAGEDTHTGTLAQNLVDAQTPDAGVHVANTARTSDVADLMNQIHGDNPDDATRGILQAVEPEISLEQTRQPGMTYEEHAQNLVDTSAKVNQEQTIPFAGIDTDAKLPAPLSKAAPRYGQSQIGFDSDVDRALYIVREKSSGQSAAHDQYMDFLKQAGLTDQQIRAGSEEVTAKIKAAARDAQKGDPLAITKTFNPDEQRSGVAKSAANEYIDRYLAGKGISDKEAKGDSMLEFLAKNGGLKPNDGGELAAMDADKWHVGKPFQKKLIKENGLNLDDAGQLLQQNGYYGPEGARPTEAELLDHISEEMGGNPRYAERNENPALAGQQAALEELDQTIHEAGIDTTGMTRADLMNALEKYSAEQQNSQAAKYSDLDRHWDTQFPEGDHAAEFGKLAENADHIQNIRDQINQNPDLGNMALASEHVDDFLEKLAMYDPESLVALSGEGGELTTLKDVLDQIKDDQNLHEAMTNCMIG